MAVPDPLRPANPIVNAIERAAYSAVDTSLQVAADKVEEINHAVWPTPPGLSVEDHVDGVYHSKITKLLDGIRGQIKRGLPVTLSLETIAAIADAVFGSKLHGGLNDRLYGLEDVLVLMSRLPPSSVLLETIQNKVISGLWFDLPHPPASVIGEQHRFRSYDGSGNSIWNPQIGKAGSPYARSVQNVQPLPSNQLPSPELLFDTLLKREAPVNHPAGLSSCFFAFANLIIHSVFSTDNTNPTNPVNKVSSYLDLSPIYGSSEEENKQCRLFDGTGRIFNDTFVDPRVLQMPPSTPALLIMFCRNHNYIVKKLLEINERGLWTNPPPSDKAAMLQQDNQLFQTARLINCGWFMSTILGDYLSSILGMVREGNNWSLNPLTDFRLDDHQVSERGTGNVVSVEFLALYQWHSAISVADEKWTEGVFKRLFPDKTWDDITVADWQKVFRGQILSAKKPPKEWTFNGMTRGPDGSFPDEDLANILRSAIESPASAFKARGAPHVLRIIEIMAIEQNRQWGTCSMNEFRKFLGLKPYSTFEEWNPRKDVADAARRLYQHPDNIELYVGLQAEETKVPVPGAGLCPGFTMSRAILADAVALVRGDRFLTSDFTAFNLTTWGITDCSRNPDNSSNGGMLGKLLSRALPNHFPAESVYTNFPFVVPSAMKIFMSKWKDSTALQSYTFDRPGATGKVVVLKTYKGVTYALHDAAFASDVPSGVQAVLPGSSFLASYNDPVANRFDNNLISDTFSPHTVIRQQFEYLSKITRTLIADRSYTLVGDTRKSINIVRDVTNLVPVYFISSFVLGLPLKTAETPHGTILDQELYLKLREIYDYIFGAVPTATKVAEAKFVKEYCLDLLCFAQTHISGAKIESYPIIGAFESAYHWLVNHPRPTREWLARLLAEGRPKRSAEFANDAVALAVVIANELSQAITNIIDIFLSSEPASHDVIWTPGPIGGDPLTSSPGAGSSKSGGTITSATPTILENVVSLCSDDLPASKTKLKGLIVDALRKRPVVPGEYRTLVAGSDGFQAGDRVFLSFTEAGKDAAGSFEEAGLFAGALVRVLGTDWVVDAAFSVIREIFRLKGIARAPGNSGQLLSFTEDIEGTQVETYLDYQQQPTLWSSDLTVTFGV